MKKLASDERSLDPEVEGPAASRENTANYRQRNIVELALATIMDPLESHCEHSFGLFEPAR